MSLASLLASSGLPSLHSVAPRPHPPLALKIASLFTGPPPPVLAVIMSLHPHRSSLGFSSCWSSLAHTLCSTCNGTVRKLVYSLGEPPEMDRHKYVKMAYHGFREEAEEDKISTYGSILVRDAFGEPDYALIDTIISLAEAYCTGGIRCEMASAYIRSKGAGFENVYQLYGGIQRYMEQFPDGGFFKGKNFVFDHRVSVGRFDGCTIGSCQLCACPFDDYSARCRCRHCRMLVLVCYDCQNPAAMYCCEICEKRCKDLEKTAQSVSTLSLSDDGAMPNCTNFPMQLNRELGDVFQRKLRILCLHGFRQNASGFRGRTASLAKKLKTLVEFVFVDAPHELPFVYQFRSSSSAKKLDAEPDCSSTFDKCRKRFAWLIESNKDLSEINNSCMAEGPFDPLQFRRQTEGLEKSLSYLNRVVSEMGPFDGVLGFSQGATMAALFCSSQRHEEAGLRFRFAILCSGYAVNSLGVVKNSINCPSLHIFGGGEGKDKQIGRNESIELASLFDEDCAVLIEHDAGHIIPTWLPYVDSVKGFLQRFL